VTPPGRGCRVQGAKGWVALMLAVVGAMWAGCERTATQVGEGRVAIQFQEVTRDSGIAFVHTDGGSGRRFIVESVSAGLALFDYDGDGDVDLYFLNGAALPGAVFEAPPRNALYRNDGGWKFTDVTRESGAGDTGYGLGVCVGDYDNDGHPDIYLNNFGPNVLYRNNGDGTFTDVTQRAGVGNGDRVGAGACFLDIDGDGDLDLFVANYIDFSLEKHQERFINGHPAYAGPMNYGPVADTLYRNNGDGTFEDISVASGIAALAGTGMGVVCFDYDDDGDTDILVGNDAMGNFVWRNDGTGRFEEVGLQVGLAYDRHGFGQGTMGVECGDFDNDGLMDVHMTSYQQQWATLYRNLGGGVFADITHASGAGAGTYPEVTWGNGLVDFDNDGRRDLFIACGHLQDTVDRWDDTTRYAAPNLVLANAGGGKFTDVSRQVGRALEVSLSSRGTAFDDLDNDGDIDVVILNARREPTLLRNDSRGGNHWLQVRLRGVRSNRDGIGARIRVVAGDLTQVAEVHSGRGYQSHYGGAPHFGLGTRTRIDRVEVRWLGGGVEVMENVGVDQVLTLTEGAFPPPR
jgi:enediyne biosynthesis protein E4